MAKLKNAFPPAAGAVADVATPHLGEDVDAARNNMQAAKLKRVILQARMRRPGTVRDSYDRFLNTHTQAIEGVDQFVLNAELGFTRMVEIGCGDGWLLDACAERLPGSPKPSASTQRRRR